MTVTRTSQAGTSAAGTSPLRWLLCLGDAALLIASGSIHLHLWFIAYRHVATLDMLFLVQVAAAYLAALAVLITRNALVMLGAAALMAGTILGFVLVRTVGLAGFRLTFSSQEAYMVLVIEAVAVVLLAATAWQLRRQPG